MPRQRAHSAEASRLDLHQQVTDQIIAALERGVRPWARPWSMGHLKSRVRRPLRACGEGYRGINVLMLWLAGTARGYRSPFWLTFRQALAQGGHVRKGETGTPVCYYDILTREQLGDDGAAREEKIPFLKHYTVFNAEQCDGLPAQLAAPLPPETEPQPEVGRSETVDRFTARLGADIVHGSNQACYTLHTDRISMPPSLPSLPPTATTARCSMSWPIMPRPGLCRAGGRWPCTASLSGAACRHSQSASRKARSWSSGR